MLDVDPRSYLPADYVVQWTCPSCGTKVQITLGKIDGTQCPECPTEMSLDDILALREFERFIA
jgi:tRNA(Ile2) C34 agmatinyltransferase TiaS